MARLLCDYYLYGMKTDYYETESVAQPPENHAGFPRTTSKALSALVIEFEVP